MTPEQAALVERLRTLLADEPVVREVSMFGGRSFMVNEKMVVSALRDGSLLVRADPDRHEDLLARPGAVQAEMGTGHSMGPGWIEVGASALGGCPSGDPGGTPDAAYGGADSRPGGGPGGERAGAPGLPSDEVLSSWLALAMEHNRVLAAHGR